MSKKIYSAPALESLSLRETRDIDISAGIDALGASIDVAVSVMS